MQSFPARRSNSKFRGKNSKSLCETKISLDRPIRYEKKQWFCIPANALNLYTQTLHYFFHMHINFFVLHISSFTLMSCPGVEPTSLILTTFNQILVHLLMYWCTTILFLRDWGSWLCCYVKFGVKFTSCDEITKRFVLL